MISDSGLSCQLSGDKFQKRKAMLKNEIFTLVEKTEELEQGFSFHFKEKQGLDAKLLELVIAERNCCPFFEIKLHFLPFQTGINLEITGQKGVKEFIKTEFLN